jgi:phosphohistidine phosphatase
MKTLYLVRHAKSDWGNEALDDIDRPLNARGYNDAHAMGKRMKAKHDPPDLIFTSDAIRALSTAIILARELGLKDGKLQVCRDLYEASTDSLLNFIRHVDDRYEKIYLVCHNPGITNLVNRVCNASIDNIPTAGIACIDIETVSWRKAGEAEGGLRYFDFPKNKV